MDAIQILSDARSQWKLLEDAKEQYARATLILHGAGLYNGRVQNSPGNPAADSAERIHQAEQDVWTAAGRLAYHHMEAQRLISTLEDCSQRLVLELYYLSLPPLSMAQTAERLEMSGATAYRLKRQALENLRTQDARQTEVEDTETQSKT